MRKQYKNKLMTIKMIGCYEIPGWLLTIGLFGLVIWLIADAIRIIIYLIEKYYGNK